MRYASSTRMTVENMPDKSPRRLFSILLLLLPMSAFSQDILSVDLGKCAQIEDDGDRLSCYDALVLPDAPAEPAPAPVADAPVEAPDDTAAATATAVATPATVAAEALAPSADGTTPITEDVGKERIEREEPEEPTVYSANVVRCEASGASGQYYFVMENGQVWKETNYRRLRWSNCRFPVNISKDGFGYKMYVAEKDRTLRVRRVR